MRAEGCRRSTCLEEANHGLQSSYKAKIEPFLSRSAGPI